MTPTAGDAKEEETARTVATEASAPGVDLLAALVAMLPRVPFEGKKDAAAIFQGLMRTTDADGKCHALAHVVDLIAVNRPREVLLEHIGRNGGGAIGELRKTWGPA